MSFVLSFSSFIGESIRNLNQLELLDWLEERKDKTFIALDTETTGLEARVDQLTQVAAVAYSFDINKLEFTKIDQFNKKIKLTDFSLDRLEDPVAGKRMKEVFSFTGYVINQDKYQDEQEVIEELIDYVNSHQDIVLIIQNSPFDMRMINVRAIKRKLKGEIFDSREFISYFYIPTLQKLAEEQPEAKTILQKLITNPTKSTYPTASLPVVAKALDIDSSGAHDALYDCEYLIEVLEKTLDLIKKNSSLDYKEYLRVRKLKDFKYNIRKNKRKRI